MVEDLKKWSILTKKEYKELDNTLKQEYIKRYGRQFYENNLQNGVFNSNREPFPRGKGEYTPSQAKKED